MRCRSNAAANSGSSDAALAVLSSRLNAPITFSTLAIFEVVSVGEASVVGGGEGEGDGEIGAATATAAGAYFVGVTVKVAPFASVALRTTSGPRYLAHKWNALAYGTHILSFEKDISQHMGNLSQSPWPWSA